jgi:CopG family nickel-responsive transcriptional regulator
MPIVSLSFPEQMINEMDEVQSSLGFTGRSELVRAGIRLLLQDVRDKSAIKGRVNAVVVLTHNEENEEAVTRIKHKFDDVVRTHVHNKTGRRTCIEIFLLEGEGSEVASMATEFQKDDGIRSVRLLLL